MGQMEGDKTRKGLAGPHPLTLGEFGFYFGSNENSWECYQDLTYLLKSLFLLLGEGGTKGRQKGSKKTGGAVSGGWNNRDGNGERSLYLEMEKGYILEAQAQGKQMVQK